MKFFNKLYETKIPVMTVPKKEVVIMLPFMGSISLAIKKSLVCSIKIPSVKLKVILIPGNRLASYFKYKDNFPKSLRSGIVYKYQCAKCNFSYIGSTYRYLAKRIEEHLHISALTGKPLVGLQVWSPMAHAKVCNVTNTEKDFTILCTETNRSLLRIKESLFIFKCKPELNTMTESCKLHLFN